MKPMLMCNTLVAPSEMQKWPKFCSIKYDGIRAIIKDGKVLSRSLKLIPNKHVQEALANLPDGLDGELILVGDRGKIYDNNQSAFMSIQGTPVFYFMVFDLWNVDAGFKQRSLMLGFKRIDNQHVRKVHQHELDTPAEAEQMYAVVREQGYEGLILKTDAAYKFGRSTLRQEYGLKLKPYDDDEAVIIGMEEMMHNLNESTENELGNLTKAKVKENSAPSGMMGALVCEYKNGNIFKIGTGFDLHTRKRLWAIKDELVSDRAQVKFKHQGLTKAGVPRGPAVYLGLRSKDDL